MATDALTRMHYRYISGTTDEPKQLLQPITGYVHEPLLPLEEACEPLTSIIPRLSAYIWIAKENSKDPTDGLTQDESAAIRLYTMEWDPEQDETHVSLYSKLNRTLRSADRANLRPWFRYLKLFLTGLAKLPLTPHQTVWRGVRKNQSGEYTPGDHVTWWAFSSCTTSLSVLESDLYLGASGTRTLFSIEAFNGRTVRSHSHFVTEDEILLLPGTYLEVKSRLNPAPDLYIIHLQQTIPPHVLLEPPFIGAKLLPGTNADEVTAKDLESQKNNKKSRPWYKQKRTWITISLISLLIILAIILGSTLGTRQNSETILVTTLTTNAMTTSKSSMYTLPDPVSVATAFYTFDGTLKDFYSNRNGEMLGGSIFYAEGYLSYGTAAVFSHGSTSFLSITPGFTLNATSNFTIEAFFYLPNNDTTATLVELMPNVSVNIMNNVLTAQFGSSTFLRGISTITANTWHHFGFLYDSSRGMGSIYFNGNLEGEQSVNDRDTLFSNNNNSAVLVGMRFEGMLDQLSISLIAKSAVRIQWDAQIAAFYPMDTDIVQDKGPNGVNATAFGVIPTDGAVDVAVNFNVSDAYYQVGGFYVLTTPYHTFSLGLWVRAETQPGVFLTIANSDKCLLVLGLSGVNNTLFAFLPNATEHGNNVLMIGPNMASYTWVHTSFTWSSKNRAKLYVSGHVQAASNDATRLNNVNDVDDTNRMTITLGNYQGTADCGNMPLNDSSTPFMGSLSDLYVASSELQDVNFQSFMTLF